jgi:CRISPR/Cas system-associated endonuclease/helicase Cas3
MKKSIVALLAAVGLLCGQPAWAQSQVINIPTTCTTAEALAELLVEYDETPALTMTSVRASKEKNKPTTNRSLMFINYETKSWTLIERMADNVFCIIGSGGSATPYVKKPRP